MLHKIPINAIFPREGRTLRKLNPQHVNLLAQSIQDIGLQCPISVRATPCPPEAPYNHNGYYYEVATGNHRLEACKQLGWKEIPAFILDMTDVDRGLWEIDENLIRAELTTLERAEHVKQRKVLYLLKYPHTANGATPGKRGGKGGKIAKSAILPKAPSFVADTAAKTGMSERSIQKAIERAEAIAEPVKQAIADMPKIADSGQELDALAAVAPEDQKAAVEAVKSGKARNVREATKGAKSARKSRSRQRRSEEQVLRTKLLALVKQYQEKAARRLASLKIRFTGPTIQVDIAYADDTTQEGPSSQS